MIIFLGTPHRGSRTAGIGQIAARLASIALQDSNGDILRSLKTDDAILNEIHEESVKIVLKRKIAIHSFQEAKGMTGIKGLSGKIVNDFSSKLGLPTIETVESIDADHRQMARCSRREDETYRKIVGELISRIKKGTFKQGQTSLRQLFRRWDLFHKLKEMYVLAFSGSRDVTGGLRLEAVPGPLGIRSATPGSISTPVSI